MTLLRDAGHNPDEHLTDEQRELLVSADYYDRLNLATAYFPSQNDGQPLMQTGANMEGVQEEDEMGEGEQQVQEGEEDDENNEGEGEGEDEEDGEEMDEVDEE